MSSLIIYFLYFLTRLINIEQLPIFNDEAFFLWVGEQIRSNPLQNIFLNFSDGKEPLFFWVYSLASNLLILRLLSVIFGFLTLFYFRKLTKNFWASLLFIFSPFLLFYQRLGMQETLLTFLLTAATYFAINKKYIYFGLFSGLSLLTKTSALAFLIPLFIFRFNFKALFICFLFYLPIFFLGQNVSAHNTSYVGLIPLTQVIINFKQAARWLFEYQGVMGVVGIMMPPVILESFIAKIFFPRYFLFIMPILIILVAKLPKFLLILFLIPNIVLSLQIIKDVKTANLPYIEKWQYIEAWPAGYGIKETALYLKSQNIKSVQTEDIMITKNGLIYYYPELITNDKNSEFFVFKKSKEIADKMGLEKIYSSYDISVYRKLTLDKMPESI